VIPENIGREHILLALGEIDGMGTNAGNRLGGFYCLVQDGKHYHPWHVIAMANRLVNGFELPQYPSPPQPEMNAFLESRGFDVVFCRRSVGVRALLAITYLLLVPALTIASFLAVFNQNRIVAALVPVLGILLIVLAWPFYRSKAWH
jgi:hypothetical protein